MKIKHTLSNNMLEVVVELRPRIHKEAHLVSVGTHQVINFCKSNNLPVGELVSEDVLCTNESAQTCRAVWVFSISKEYKKSLTLKTKNAKVGNVSSTNKKTSVRARAKNIVRSRSSRKKKVENNEEPTSKPSE